MASVVGTGTNINTNTYLDTCSAQGNYVFLNSTAPGTSCVDITLTLNNGPNYINVDLVSEEIRSTPINCGEFENPNWLICQKSLDSAANAVTYQLLYSHLGTMTISYSCSSLSINGASFVVILNSVTEIVYPTITAPAGMLQNIPVYSPAGETITIKANPNTQPLIGICYISVSIIEFGSITPDAGGAMYSTSYVDGPPQQWYYPLSGETVDDARSFEKERRLFDKFHK